MVGKPVKSSPVWDYFSYSGTGKYSNCKICKKDISLGSEVAKSQTLHGLKRHLETTHKDEWKKISDQLKPKTPKTTEKRARNDEPGIQLNCPTKKARNELLAQTVPGQPSVSNWQKSCQTWAFHDPRAQAQHKAIFEYMVTDMQPWTTVDGAGFVRMYKKACPNFEIASHKYYADMLDPAYEKIKNKIKAQIEEANPEVFSITLDGWSEFKNGYLGINVHYIADFKKHVRNIGCSPFSDRHTGSF